MPGSTSQPYEPPICKCEHFGDLHDDKGCQAEGCDCREFRWIPLAQSELGKATDAFIRAASRETPT